MQRLPKPEKVFWESL